MKSGRLGCSFEDVLFCRMMQMQTLCNSIRNLQFMRKLKRVYSILGLSIFVQEVLANEIRLGAAEPYKNGPYAKVVYIDHEVPWAEFVFIYKSMGIIYGRPSDY